LITVYLSVGVGVLGVLMVTICCFSSSKIIYFWKKDSQTHKSVDRGLSKEQWTSCH
jgi:serine/threonine protein kinase